MLCCQKLERKYDVSYPVAKARGIGDTNKEVKIIMKYLFTYALEKANGSLTYENFFAETLSPEGLTQYFIQVVIVNIRSELNIHHPTMTFKAITYIKELDD